MLNPHPHHRSSTPPAGVNNACSGTGPKFAKQVVRSLSHTLVHIATVPNTPSHARAEKNHTHTRQLAFSFVSARSTGRPQGDWHIRNKHNPTHTNRQSPTHHHTNGRTGNGNLVEVHNGCHFVSQRKERRALSVPVSSVKGAVVAER